MKLIFGHYDVKVSTLSLAFKLYSYISKDISI